MEARHWTKNFELVGRGILPLPILEQSLYSVWGFAGVGKSAIVKTDYFKLMCRYHGQTRKFGWVDVPNTFSLIDLSSRLLADFHSDNLESKETVAVGMMEGQDPVQGCRKFLQQGNYYIVIDGLRSIHDWDLIKVAFFSEPFKGSVLVVTNEERLAKYFADQNSYQSVNVKGLEADAALNLYKKVICSLLILFC
jgi:hypothetical protein